VVPEGAPCERAEDRPAPLGCSPSGRCVAGEDSRNDAAVDALPDPVIPPACENTVVCPDGGTKTYFQCGSDCYIPCSTSAPFSTANMICETGADRIARVNTISTQECFEGHLATLTDEARIGLVQSPDATSPGEGWIWTNGVPLGFANWLSPPEPNDGDGSENGYEPRAASYPSGRWHDTRCTGPSRRVLCEVGH